MLLPSVKRFDMKRPPFPQHLGWLIRLLSIPDLVSHRNTLTRVNMDGITGPYLLLCNHNAFMDFKVASKAMYPRRANFVVAIDGFIKREWLLRWIGCICTRKFTQDLMLIRQMREVVSRGDIAVLYPEARYSLCGTTAVLPDSIGKLAKLLNVPVVTLICHGHHVNSPFWNLRNRKVKGTQAVMTGLLTAEQTQSMSADEINAVIREAFVYDDFAWQKENNIRIDAPFRAEGLHKVLYQCPHCGTEYRMTSKGHLLTCEACGKTWEMTPLGELQATDGDTEFSHIPDWYEWERANVRREVESGTYCLDVQTHVKALPNARGYIDLGSARLVHNADGFRLTGMDNGEPYTVTISVPSIYSCHIEYNYLGKFGDCIDLNTKDDTLYIYPEGDQFAITKIALATEELYEARRHKKS